MNAPSSNAIALAAQPPGQLATTIDALLQELAATRARLPEGMQHCTILYKSCPLGHGWLTATNWAQHNCPTCQRDQLIRKVRLLRRYANQAGLLTSTEDHSIAQLLHDIRHS